MKCHSESFKKFVHYHYDENLFTTYFCENIDFSQVSKSY